MVNYGLISCILRLLPKKKKKTWLLEMELEEKSENRQKEVKSKVQGPTKGKLFNNWLGQKKK